MDKIVESIRKSVAVCAKKVLFLIFTNKSRDGIINYFWVCFLKKNKNS